MKVSRQRPVRGGRTKMSAGFIRDIERAVRHTADRFQVSRSWVVADILADFFGIEEQRRFETVWRGRRRGN